MTIAMNCYCPRIDNRTLLTAIRSGLSPREVFRRIPPEKSPALLDSSMDSDAARYSFIGMDPILTFTATGRRISIENGKNTVHITDDPFDRLKDMLGKMKISNDTEHPFTAGLIGYFSYDLKNTIEDLPPDDRTGPRIPDIYLVLYRRLLIFDRKSPGALYLSVIKEQGQSLSRDAEISYLEEMLEKAPPVEYGHTRGNYPEYPVSDFTRKEYISAVERIKEHIKAGNIYQACLSQRFRTFTEIPPFELYDRLQRISPSPFGAYIPHKGIHILSSSPELFLRVTGNRIETRPMKGTRPRSTFAETDPMLIDLIKSEKDMAELMMIVDLERNDLGRVSVPGSVTVEDLRRVESYNTVHQTISVISAMARKDITLPDIIKAAFPGGSITGCPKISSMRILSEIEPVRRGIYTGSIGYISLHDTMDLNIAIRTMLYNNGEVLFHAGGGIVADSDPEEEYEETLHKARAMMTALGIDLK